MLITHKTQLNLVIGHPLTHTQSPLLHSLAYEILQIDAVLLALANTDMSAIMQVMKTMPIKLAAVTMPFKSTILSYLNEMSEDVKRLGAANTIIQHENVLYGYNTDIDGIRYALKGVALRNKNVLIFGAGGAARAAGYVMQAEHANLFWLNRTREKANALAAHFGGVVIEESQLNDMTIDVIINASAVGMHPNIQQTPLPSHHIHSNQIVFDMVYHPAETLLLQLARARGATCVSGIEMFIGQGIKQIELWKNKIIDENDICLIKQKLIHAQYKNEVLT